MNEYKGYSIEKCGTSYRIKVSLGRDSKGKQIIERATYKPDPDLTLKQQEKALHKFAYEFEQKARNGLILDGEKITFQEFTERWLVEYAEQQLTATTVNGYKRELNARILPQIGHIKLAKLQPLHLQSFYNKLSTESCRLDGSKGTLSPASVKRYHTIIRSILKWAVRWNIIDQNPCERVAPPKVTPTQDKIKHFTLEQAETFLKALDIEYQTTYKSHDRVDDTGKPYSVREYIETRAIPTQFKLLYTLALFTGLRRGELIALTWDDIDFEEHTLSITKSTGYVGTDMVTKSPKTHSSIRTISLPSSLVTMLKRYRLEQNQYRLSLSDQWLGENHLFIQWNGKQMNLSMSYHTFVDIINKYNKTVSNDADKLPVIPFHGLRHTSATILISQNLDIRTVSGRLGHAQTSTTMNIYAHSLKKMDEVASETFDKLFRKKA